MGGTEYCGRDRKGFSYDIRAEWEGVSKVGGRGRKDMFYLTMHSTHLIYGYMASDIVKDHSDSEKGNPLPPHRLLFPINSKGSFILHHPTDRIAHATAFVGRERVGF